MALSNILRALFDIKPITESGEVDVSKIESAQRKINLRKRKFKAEKQEVDAKESVGTHLASSPKGITQTEPIDKQIQATEEAISDVISSPSIGDKAGILQELEFVLNQEKDIKIELAQIGAKVQNEFRGKPRYRMVTQKGDSDFQNRILSQIRTRYTPPAEEAKAEMASGVTELPPLIPSRGLATETGLGDMPAEVKNVNIEDFYKKHKHFKPYQRPGAEKKSFWRKKNLLTTGVSLAGIGVAVYFGYFGINIKNQAMKNGSSAVQNLSNAGDSIKALNFASASYSFARAYEDFTSAGNDINFLGASVSSLLSDLPGAGKLKSAQSLVEIGKLMSTAGKAMTDAMGLIAKTGEILKPGASLSNVNASNIIALKEALMVSQSSLAQTAMLIKQVDGSIIPEDKKEIFLQFKDKIPEFEKIVTDSVGYADFMEKLVGSKGTTKKYILLFQNYSELRPTGGFPGTYGVVTFENGGLKEFFVDDIYNPDGQLKEQIIPPRELQHITPTWGMRDAGWFIDFPMSARKTMSFYKKEVKQDVDGVITISPKPILEILKILGPIEMPDYKLTLDSSNFLEKIQNEVEYGPNRTQPKQVLKDMAPKFLEKIYSASQDEWMKIFNVLVQSVGAKDMMMYFNDLSLESFAVERGFGGQVKNTNSDYLTVNISNIKGSKSDLVTDTSLKVTTTFEDSKITHRLFITRKHNGGNLPYGFYNKQSPAFIRVLVPEGSKLLDINGNSNIVFRPLVDYSRLPDFKRDSDLVALEDGESVAGEEVSIRHEAGKQEFGFWMVVDPGESKTIELSYTVPAELAGKDYKLFIQKQPGINIDKMELVLDARDNIKIGGTAPLFNFIGTVYSLDTSLNEDFPLEVEFK